MYGKSLFVTARLKIYRLVVKMQEPSLSEGFIKGIISNIVIVLAVRRLYGEIDFKAGFKIEKQKCK